MLVKQSQLGNTTFLFDNGNNGRTMKVVHEGVYARGRVYNPHPCFDIHQTVASYIYLK